MGKFRLVIMYEVCSSIIHGQESIPLYQSAVIHGMVTIFTSPNGDHAIGAVQAPDSDGILQTSCSIFAGVGQTATLPDPDFTSVSDGAIGDSGAIAAVTGPARSLPNGPVIIVYSESASGYAILQRISPRTSHSTITLSMDRDGSTLVVMPVASEVQVYRRDLQTAGSKFELFTSFPTTYAERYFANAVASLGTIIAYRDSMATVVVVAMDVKTGLYRQAAVLKDEACEAPCSMGDSLAITSDGNRVLTSVCHHHNAGGELMKDYGIVWQRNREGGFDRLAEIEAPTAEYTALYKTSFLVGGYMAYAVWQPGSMNESVVYVYSLINATGTGLATVLQSMRAPSTPDRYVSSMGSYVSSVDGGKILLSSVGAWPVCCGYLTVIDLYAIPWWRKWSTGMFMWAAGAVVAACTACAYAWRWCAKKGWKINNLIRLASARAFQKLDKPGPALDPEENESFVRKAT